MNPKSYIIISLILVLSNLIMFAVTTNSRYQNKIITVNGVSFEMIYVKGGNYKRGATPEQFPEAKRDEKPVTEVYVNDFLMGKYEVTQELWNAVMDYNPSYFKGDSLPVENVSWKECNEFIKKINRITGENFRLPSEKEWEFAARGGIENSKYKYSGSDSIDSVAWYYINSDNKTHKAGTKHPNALNIYDMNGNVSEWCNSWVETYTINYYTPIPEQGKKITGNDKIFRGGSWINRAQDCRVSSRFYWLPDSHHSALGFRLSLNINI